MSSFPSATPNHSHSNQPTSPDQLLTPTGSEHVFAPFSVPPNLEEIRQVFRLFDKNGDGSISPEELIDTMKCCGLEPTEHQIKVLVSNADSTGSGSIDFGEFAALLGEHNFLTADDLKDAFIVFDQDGDGYIDADELGAFLQAIGETVTLEQAAEMLKEADLNGDGLIDYEEFSKMMQTPSQQYHP